MFAIKTFDQNCENKSIFGVFEKIKNSNISCAFLTVKPHYIAFRHFNNFTILIVELKCHCLLYQDSNS